MADWLTEPEPVFDQLTVGVGPVGHGGWGSDSQQLRIQARANLATWSEPVVTSPITGRGE